MTPEEAKALVAGDLGQEMGKLALRFCKPIFFGAPPSREHPAAINSATASLLKLRGEPLAVTCAPVIEGYRRKKLEEHKCMFAIANCYLDPLNQLIAEDSTIDAAVVRLTEVQAKQITRDSNGIGEALYEIGPKPPTPVTAQDF